MEDPKQSAKYPNPQDYIEDLKEILLQCHNVLGGIPFGVNKIKPNTITKVIAAMNQVEKVVYLP